ncbi:MAG TPA: preprotein translocase subunit YajC [Ferruginibacter sp.]|nr:preprotein translocase subunit YajC [Ferruginibacter sp.]
MQLLSIFLQAAAPQGPNMIYFLIPMIVVVYFFMIRPQSKKGKEQKAFIENLQKGDKVVTIAGIHGVINKVNDDGTVSLEVSPGSYIKIEKSAVHLEWSAAINKPAADTTATDKK